MVLCVSSLIGLTVLIGCASAESTDELLLALLKRDGSAPVIHRGGLPVGLDLDLPETGRLVGSAEWSDSSEIILSFEASPAEAGRAMTESLVSQGWKLAPAVERRGFVDSGETYNALLCGEDREYYSLSVEPENSGSSLATLRYGKEGSYSPCVAGEPYGLLSPPNDVFPELAAPRGANWRGGGGGGVPQLREPGDSSYQATVVESALSVTELLEHYGDQMKPAGWKLTDQLVGEEASVQFWARSGENGEEFLGSLVVVELSGSSAEVILRVMLRRARTSA